VSGFAGVDVGGTFTDLLILDDETGFVAAEKVLTTYPDPSEAVRQCLERSVIPVDDLRHFRHGTTLGINIIIEGKGGPTGLITTTGFKDVLVLRRGSRSETFNMFWTPLPPLIDSQWRLEVVERVDSSGEVLLPVDMDELHQVVRQLVDGGITAVGICFMNSYVNPHNERVAAQAIRDWFPQMSVSISSDLGSQLGEYERTSTVAINAILQPVMNQYLEVLDQYLDGQGFQGEKYLMQSTGGVTSFDRARRYPSLVIESGPAAGVVAAGNIARICEITNIIALDVGGTTAKAAAIIDGVADITNAYHVGGERGYVLQVPGIDIVEVGAGGGSIAYVDVGGALRVGPRSAGASPGPACYGLGGTEPTITDANVVLGRLNPERFAMGAMRLNTDAAHLAIASVSDELGLDPVALAAGIVDIGSTIMASVVRAVTIERGIDPRGFALVAYGGAGPMQACDVARQLHIGTVVIPPYPGHFSSVGLLFTRSRMDYVKSVAIAMNANNATDLLHDEFNTMRKSADEAIPANAGEIALELSADMRYPGQWHTVTVRLSTIDSSDAIVSAFTDTFLRRFGHVVEGGIPEIVALRLGVEWASHDSESAASLLRYGATEESQVERRPVFLEEVGDFFDCPIYRRESLVVGSHLEGPAIVEEEASTTFLRGVDSLEVNDLGCLVVSIGNQ
jgi:N-methylhydantoinase A